MTTTHRFFTAQTLSSWIKGLSVLFFALSSFFSFATAQQADTSDSTKKKVKIGFLFRHMGLRGVEGSAYNYADKNEELLGNESYIFLLANLSNPTAAQDYPKEGIEKFKNRFKERFYICQNFAEADALMAKLNIDILYNQKAGQLDSHVSKSCRNAIHAVFLPLQPHGDVYATISSWLSEQRPDLSLPYVPYIVEMPKSQESLRVELGIPPQAVVFGRHGGYDSFDIDYAKKVVIATAEKRPDVYFLFLNTEPFCKLPNVYFFAGTTDIDAKTKFINTCDAMLHARARGETFGHACAEFSVKNKPVITCRTSPELAHVQILGKKGLYYSNQEELTKVMENVINNISSVREGNWDAYSEQYNAKTVMEKFDRVFIQPLQTERVSNTRSNITGQRTTCTTPFSQKIALKLIL